MQEGSSEVDGDGFTQQDGTDGSIRAELAAENSKVSGSVIWSTLTIVEPRESMGKTLAEVMVIRSVHIPIPFIYFSNAVNS